MVLFRTNTIMNVEVRHVLDICLTGELCNIVTVSLGLLLSNQSAAETMCGDVMGFGC